MPENVSRLLIQEASEEAKRKIQIIFMVENCPKFELQVDQNEDDPLIEVDRGSLIFENKGSLLSL